MDNLPIFITLNLTDGQGRTLVANITKIGSIEELDSRDLAVSAARIFVEDRAYRIDHSPRQVQQLIDAAVKDAVAQVQSLSRDAMGI